MINKTYLHPIRTSNYSNNLPLCHVLTYHLASNKISLYSILSLLSSRIVYHPAPTVLKIVKLASTGDKKIGAKSLFPDQSST